MSEYVVKLPDVGEGIAEAEIVEWHVNAGDTITEDQVMVEVMTDKATVELPSPVAGVVLSIGAAVGDVLQVGAPLIRIDTGGAAADVAGDRQGHEDREAPAPAAVPEPVVDPPAPSSTTAEPVAAATSSPAPDPAPRSTPTAAPAVRQRAKSLGVDLAAVEATGPDGRVVHADLDAHITRNGSRRVAPTIAG